MRNEVSFDSNMHYSVGLINPCILNVTKEPPSISLFKYNLSSFLVVLLHSITVHVIPRSACVIHDGMARMINPN